MTRRAFLICGVLASMLYGAMIVSVGMLWEGYRSASQTVSELSAIGAPTRPLWVVLGGVYALLMTAFGWGVWQSARRNLALRVVGGSLIAHGLIGLAWPPMHQRAVLAAGGGTLTDTMHIVWALVTVLLMITAIGFGAAAFAKQFRFYSFATIAILAGCGTVTGLAAPRIQANLPTPWIGVWERINIGVFLVWVAMLATTLLRGRDRVTANGHQDGLAA